MIVNNQIISGKELAEIINEAFVSVTQHLDPLIDSSNDVQIMNGYDEDFSEFLLSEIEVYHKLSSISTSKSSGSDDIPNWVLKFNAMALALPVASILNASIRQSTVPTIWKRADVIPIQKTKHLNDIKTDLRPISLTATLAKICEHFIADWLMKAISDMIDKRQFGSLKGSSTTHALLSLIHHILSKTDSSGNVIRIFLLDFAKAFDHIDHDILLNKLATMHVPHVIINWIRNFLTNREQRVRISIHVSEWRRINGGVPQGTVLGPLLFLIMINDLLENWNDRWKYVDDTSVSECVEPGGVSNLQEVVDYISTWTNNNNMKLNILKCKELIIDFSNEKRIFPPLQIADNHINRVDSTRILGITLQSNMKWNIHVENIIKKASKRLYMLRLLRKSNANNETLIIVYCTVIRPILEYACQVWHYNIRDYLCEDIERVQKRALKIIVPSLSYSEALTITNLTTLRERRCKLCEQFFEKNGSSDRLTDLFPDLKTSNYDLRSLNKYNMYACKTDRFKNSFFPQIMLNQRNFSILQ